MKDDNVFEFRYIESDESTIIHRINSDVTCFVLLEHFKRFLLSAGYHPESIKNGMREVSKDEIGD